jgi:hypothetical protein
MLGHVRLSTFRERLIRAGTNRIDKWQNVEGQRHVEDRVGAAIIARLLSSRCGVKTRIFAATMLLRIGWMGEIAVMYNHTGTW